MYLTAVRKLPSSATAQAFDRTSSPSDCRAGQHAAHSLQMLQSTLHCQTFDRCGEITARRLSRWFPYPHSSTLRRSLHGATLASSPRTPMSSTPNFSSTLKYAKCHVRIRNTRSEGNANNSHLSFAILSYTIEVIYTRSTSCCYQP